MGRLRSLDLELEAVTPLWIGGADTQAELRPPSVRGCLRYWLRALLGGSLGEGLADLRAAESAVYGGTTRASTVAVRMTGAPRTSVAVTDGDDQLPGLNYMFWSVFQRKRDAILPGERFQLRIQSRPLPLATVEVAGRTLDMAGSFELAAASLWLFLRLGGVGARARRGGGGVRVVGEAAGWPESLPALASKAATPAELAAELGAGIQRIRQVARWPDRPPGPGGPGSPQSPQAQPSSFDILHERVCQIYVVERTFASWCEALNWAGERFLAFRVEQRADASGIAGLLTQGRLAVRTIQRAILGLPIVFFFKSIFADLTARGVDAREARRKASATVAPARGQARASPLFFRVVPLAGQPGAWAVVIGLFRSRLLPDNEMTVRPNDSSMRPVRVEVPPDFALLDKWFDYLKGQDVGLLAVAIQ